MAGGGLDEVTPRHGACNPNPLRPFGGVSLQLPTTVRLILPIVKKIAGEFVETEIDGELILMHIDTGRFFGMKETSLAVWKLLDEYQDTDDITSALIELYSASKEECANDVKQFILDIDRAGFVVVK